MRDIVQTSVTIYNPYSGNISGGSKIKPTTEPIEIGDGFLDENGYLFDESELFDTAELWSLM